MQRANFHELDYSRTGVAVFIPPNDRGIFEIYTCNWTMKTNFSWIWKGAWALLKPRVWGLDMLIWQHYLAWASESSFVRGNNNKLILKDLWYEITDKRWQWVLYAYLYISTVGQCFKHRCGYIFSKLIKATKFLKILILT